MADPIIPGAVRLLAIQPSVTGLPEDVIVNSLAFIRGTGPATIADLVDAVAAMYNAGIEGFRPQQLVEPDMEFRSYELGEPPPREPTIEYRTVARSSASGVLPEEVAVCCSYFGSRNLPRSRGRMFLGPWSSPVLSSAGGHTRVSVPVAQAVVTAVSTMVASAMQAGWFFGVVSQRDGNFVVVTDGWVDDAFDTQRRRGPAPTSRLTWQIA